MEEMQPVSPTTTKELSPGWSVTTWILFVCYLIWWIIAHIIDWEYEPTVAVIFFLMFSLSHSTLVYGFKNTLFFFLEAIIITFAYQDIAIIANFCDYHYTDKLGIKLDHVPLVIPIAWFGVEYFSFCVTNIIIYHNVYTHDSSYNQIKYVFIFFEIIFVSFINAMIMTAWDILMDYNMSIKQGHWIWENVDKDDIDYINTFYGIPVCNYYALWLPISFLVSFVYRIWLYFSVWEINRINLDSIHSIIISVFLPVICYTISVWIDSSIFIKEVKSLVMIGVFTSGFISSLAWYNSIFIIPFKSTKKDDWTPVDAY